MVKKAKENEVVPRAGIDKTAPRGYVYICKADNGLVKIGRSLNWKSRIRSLSTSLPYKLTILFVFECALDVEPFLHQQFQHGRIHGEWFNLTPDEIRSIPRHIIKRDPLAGRYLPGYAALKQESKLPSWLAISLRRVEAKGILCMFDVVLYQDCVTVEFDIEAKIRALLTLAKYHKIPNEQIYKAITEGI